jgi:hypothetical protein
LIWLAVLPAVHVHVVPPPLQAASAGEFMASSMATHSPSNSDTNRMGIPPFKILETCLYILGPKVFLNAALTQITCRMFYSHEFDLLFSSVEI